MRGKPVSFEASELHQKGQQSRRCRVARIAVVVARWRWWCETAADKEAADRSETGGNGETGCEACDKLHKLARANDHEDDCQGKTVKSCTNRSKTRETVSSA